MAAEERTSVWLLVGALCLGCGGEVGDSGNGEVGGSGDGDAPDGTDQVLQGYLVLGCTWQAYPQLPDVKSADGFSCQLDVFFSAERPESWGSAACEQEPVSSRCLLEEAGLATGESVVQVSLDGSWQMLSTCRLDAGCASKMKDCGQQCQPERVFVPTAVSGQ